MPLEAQAIVAMVAFVQLSTWLDAIRLPTVVEYSPMSLSAHHDKLRQHLQVIMAQAELVRYRFSSTGSKCKNADIILGQCERIAIALVRYERAVKS